MVVLMIPSRRHAGREQTFRLTAVLVSIDVGKRFRRIAEIDAGEVVLLIPAVDFAFSAVQIIQQVGQQAFVN